MTPLSQRSRGFGGGRGGRGPRRERPDDGFEQRIVELARVTRVMGGGKRMRFRALVVLGNRQGKVGAGLAKGSDVSLAVSKATAKARRAILSVPLKGDTLPHQITIKYKSARVLLKPAPTGTGIIAGGPVRAVLELAGVPNVVSKILGSSNKINNVRAVMQAFSQLKLKS
ncbi:MAG: 30S ribosomal protein S5 [Candidatus Veblenbacteria bacterium]|nr:30S ribosomal protein S5 [Candidatus Veblenbacteria bacterium]